MSVRSQLIASAGGGAGPEVSALLLAARGVVDAARAEAAGAAEAFGWPADKAGCFLRPELRALALALADADALLDAGRSLDLRPWPPFPPASPSSDAVPAADLSAHEAALLTVELLHAQERGRQARRVPGDPVDRLGP